MSSVILIVIFLIIFGQVSHVHLRRFDVTQLKSPEQVSGKDTSALEPKLAPLPPVPFPSDNPITAKKIALGKQLFFDIRLSRDNKMSCATCHNPNLGYGDGLPRAIGHSGRELSRNTPPLYTTAYQNLWMWDGRARSLEEQVLMPIYSRDEMNLDLYSLGEKLSNIPSYTRQFQETFGDPAINQQNIARSLTSFLRSIVPGDAPLDKFLKGDKSALSPSAKRGLELYLGKARCNLCHNGPNLTDDGFHNIGVSPAGPLKEDPGRYKVVPLPALNGAFKTPSLRMVELTAPYMHNGVFATLEEVIEFYDRGGDTKKNLAPEMKPLKLSAPEKKDLKRFLLALTGPQVTIDNLNRPVGLGVTR